MAQDFNALCREGVQLYQKGEHDAAMRTLDKAVVIGSSAEDMAVLHKNRAAVQSARQEWSEALKALDLALEYTSDRRLRARCLLKRSYCLSALERHEDALSDALAVESDEERVRQRIHQCRMTLRAEKRALAAESETAGGMVHESQRLRLFLRGENEIRLGNEFGLWRATDWSTVVFDTERPARLKWGKSALLEMSAKGRARYIGEESKEQIIVRPFGDNWKRRPLAVLSLPHSLQIKDNTLGATCCREVAGLVLAEAPGALGIGGKLWDASFSLLRLIAHLKLQDATILELGSGIGLVGLAAAKKLHAPSVFLTDIAPVIPLLDLNIRLNSCTSSTHAIELDWFKPDHGLKKLISSIHRPSSSRVILMADLVYDPCLHKPLLDTLEALFTAFQPRLVLLAHRHRNPHDAQFFSALEELFFVLSSADNQESLLYKSLQEDGLLSSSHHTANDYSVASSCTDSVVDTIVGIEEVPPDVILIRILGLKTSKPPPPPAAVDKSSSIE